MFKNLLNLATLNEKIKSTLYRFPLVCIFICLSFVFALFKNHNIYPFDTTINTNILYASLLSIIPLTSLKLYKENHQNMTTIVYLLIAVMLVSLVSYNVIYFDLNSIFISLASIVSLTFAPYLFVNNTNKDFIFFNWQGIISIAFAFLASSILVLGVNAILASIDYLFNIKISSNLYEDILIFGYIVLFPTFVLSGIANSFSFDNEEFLSNKALNILIKNILLPLLYIYMIILYLYFFKILIQAQLPKGNLASMIIAFGSIGIFAKMIVFALKDKSSKILVLFDKYYFHFMIVPIGMLIVSFVRRVGEYGITESRYAIALFILWFTFLTVFSIIKKQKFNFKYIVSSLCLLLLLATLGPISATNISAKSQLKRFENALIKNDLLLEGKVLKSNKTLSFESRLEISSIVDYLLKNKVAVKELNLMFEELNLNEKRFIKSRESILDFLGIKYTTKWMLKNQPIKFNINNIAISSKGYDNLIYFNIHKQNNSNFKYLDLNGKKSILEIDMKDGILNLNFDKKSKSSFDLNAVMLKLKKKKIDEINENNLNEVTLKSLSNDKKFDIQIRINYLYSYENRINTIECYIMFSQNSI